MKTLWCRPADARASEVRVGRGIAAGLAQAAEGRQVFALVDAAVADWGGLSAGWTSHRARPGEEQKTLAAAEEVLRRMVAAGLDRQSLLIALGGGAVGDCGAFCASLFQRGIEVWQVPTTLLAMVDSAVGGKTAVNLPEGKNLVGTIHPASLVVADVDFVASLPEPQFRSGLAEAVKMGVGLDRELFVLLETERAAVLRRDPDILLEVVERSVAAKIAVVEGDLREHGRRRLLNLGHTLGHAIEAIAAGRQPHGHCVARGLHFALGLARDLGALTAADFTRCSDLLSAYDFHPDALPAPELLMRFVANDKKVQGGSVQFALPTGVGESRVEPLGLDVIRRQLGG